jgi:hypothetical protein
MIKHEEDSEYFNSIINMFMVHVENALETEIDMDKFQTEREKDIIIKCINSLNYIYDQSYF